MGCKWEEVLRELDRDQLEIQKEMTRFVQELDNICRIKNPAPIEKDNALSKIEKIENNYSLLKDILRENFILKITLIESLIGFTEAELKAVKYSETIRNKLKGDVCYE